MSIDAGTRWFGLWDVYFAVSYAVTAALMFTGAGAPAGRFMALAALTLAIPWYAAFGRAARMRARGRRGVVFSAGLFVLLTVAVAADVRSAFALFAVVPMVMISLPPPLAMTVATAANLLPVIVVWLGGGDIVSVLPTSLLGIALSVLLGLWITRVTQQSTARAELIEELRRNRQQVADLSRRAGIAAERERLAREIHDTIAQGLTSIISLIQAAETDLATDPELARSHLGLAATVARDNLAEAREFVTELTPPALQESSLVQAARRQAASLTAQTGMRADVLVEGTERELPMAASVVLLRSMQEAIANIRKHAAGARAAEIRLRYDAATAHLRVSDDGPGLTTGEGYGLRGMRARAQQIGGAAAVSGATGRGTTVEVTVPVHEGESR